MRLIDADALKDRVGYIEDEYGHINEEINNMPTIEAEPIRHGHWIYNGYQTKCSVCGDTTELEDGQRWDSPYCPSCGCKMDETI